ncbi:GGDEF domain-containing protein [Henriciella algicola]|uniref:diguanylate cyclase n=2 Tax=Henriciella algicola TaxID=1608422 RepID=A0A399RM04_9PROT|nr:GGDEF domain-containing protein [Henriciella algicola]
MTGQSDWLPMITPTLGWDALICWRPSFRKRQNIEVGPVASRRAVLLVPAGIPAYSWRMDRPSEQQARSGRIRRATTPAEKMLEALDLPLACGDVKVDAGMRALAEEVLYLRGQEARLHRALSLSEALADRDALCPVFNRRAFVREISREMALSRRHGSSLCLVYIDLDRFKLVNDRFGHATGDKALKSVCKLINSNIRETDIVGRLGGDEFGVILSHALRSDGEAKTAELTKLIGDMVITAPDGRTGEPVSLGASCGIVQWDGRMGADALIAAADEAMYRSKTVRRQTPK